MTQIKFEEMVAALVKPGQDIINSLTPEKADLLHMAVGVSGEAGELLDAIKKHVMYVKPLDRENVIEEIGDVLFYLQGICNNLGITFKECKVANIAKLSVRYNGLKYSNEAAQNRADKQ